MAAIAAMRTALTHLGFTQDMATMITNVQGVDSIDELKFLDDKGVEVLCNNIHKPGGMMPNSDAAVRGEPAMIRNPGQGVSEHAKNNLKLCCYFIHHRERVTCSYSVHPGWLVWRMDESYQVAKADVLSHRLQQEEGLWIQEEE